MPRAEVETEVINNAIETINRFITERENTMPNTTETINAVNTETINTNTTKEENTMTENTANTAVRINPYLTPVEWWGTEKDTNFIKLYPGQYLFTREMFDDAVDEAITLFLDRDYPLGRERYGVEEMIREWYTACEPLMRLFSYHPNWDPKRFMIRFDSDFSREIILSGVVDFAYYVESVLTHIYMEEDAKLPEDWQGENGDYFSYCYEMRMSHHKLIDTVKRFIKSINSQFFNNEYQERINNINEYNDQFRLRTNMKASKAVQKICRVLGLDKRNPDEFNRRYAAFSDCVNPVLVTRHTVLSLNYIDFLLMSNGNSWRSCHDMNYYGEDVGCYSSGCISYMLDNATFIFYTVDKSFDGDDIQYAPKMTRQVYGLKNGTLYQSRLYPQSMDYGAEEQYTDIRNIIQKVIADCKKAPNLWTVSHNIDKVNEYVKLGTGATCYPDWHEGNPGSHHTTLSVLQGREPVKMYLGTAPICPVCGRKHSNTESIICYDCGGTVYECEDCGARITDEDDIHYVDDYDADGYYCNDCCFWCERTEAYHRNCDCEELHYLNRYGTECCVDVYDRWARDNACWVENRDEYWDEDDVISVTTGKYSHEWRVCNEDGETFYLCEGTDDYYDEDLIIVVEIEKHGWTEEHYYSKSYFEENEEEIRTKYEDEEYTVRAAS